MNTSHALELEFALLPSAAHEIERSRLAADAARAFDRVVVAEQAYVARLVGRLLGWRTDVDDVVQDVFVSALAAWPKFRGECAARTWLARIAINRCRSYQRRRLVGLGLVARLRERFSGHAPTPATNPIERDEECEKVRGAMSRLRPRDREVLVLHYLEELPAAEVATLLGLSRGTVEVRLTRARCRLKKILEPMLVNQL
jgi:RNA polymerase sigma-70 factor (ECF subfamily)